MQRFTTHIIKEIVSVFFAVIVTLILIMVSFQLARLLGEAASGNITGSSIYKLLALQTINLFVILAPFAFFIAVIIGLTKLAIDSELIAMKALGFSNFRLYLSIYIIAIPLALSILYLTLSIQPKILALSYALKHQAKKESQLSAIQPGKFRTIGNEITVFVSEIQNDKFSQFFVWNTNENKQSILVAKDGKQIKNDGRRFIELYSGSRYTWNTLSSELITFEKLHYVMPKIPLESVSQRMKAIPTAHLLAQKSITNTVELHKRIAPAVSVLLLALLAPLLIRTNPRENRSGTYVIAVLSYALYANTLIILQSLIIKDTVPLWIGAYAGHVIFFTLVSTLWLIKQKRLA